MVESLKPAWATYEDFEKKEERERETFFKVIYHTCHFTPKAHTLQ
jgi:hypothetical protein